jgi:hypothetical protein
MAEHGIDESASCPLTLSTGNVDDVKLVQFSNLQFESAEPSPVKICVLLTLCPERSNQSFISSRADASIFFPDALRSSSTSKGV